MNCFIILVGGIMLDRQVISLLVFIVAVSVFAEEPQTSETTITPSIRYSPWVPLLGSQMAPSSNSTEGPAGRPNLELAPMSSGTLNALTPSMKKRPAPAVKRMPADAEVSRKATSPFPNAPVNENPIKSNQTTQ